MTQIDWSKAPAHATHWCPGNVRIPEGWIYQAGDEFYSCYSNTGLEHIPNFPDWRKERLIQRPQLQEWTGSGLPPVGIDVEIHNKSGRGVVEGAESFIGSTCKVMATFINMNGYEMVSVEDSGGSCMCFRADMCGLIRTPAQLAAEEREKAIEFMMQMTSSLGHSDVSKKILFGELYDKGLRFEVKP